MPAISPIGAKPDKGPHYPDNYEDFHGNHPLFRVRDSNTCLSSDRLWSEVISLALFTTDHSVPLTEYRWSTRQFPLWTLLPAPLLSSGASLNCDLLIFRLLRHFNLKNWLQQLLSLDTVSIYGLFHHMSHHLGLLSLMMVRLSTPRVSNGDTRSGNIFRAEKSKGYKLTYLPNGGFDASLPSIAMVPNVCPLKCSGPTPQHWKSGSNNVH